MKTLTINLPDAEDEQEVRMRLAGFLLENGVYTYGQAADLAGIPKQEFIETIGRYGFSLFSDDLTDMVKAKQQDLDVDALKKAKRYTGIDWKRLDELATEMDIQETFDELVGMVNK